MGSLEDGAFIVPVKINGQGPLLFAVNPRAASSIDRRVAERLGLYMERTRIAVSGESDTIVNEMTERAEVLKLEVGTLTVTGQHFMVYPATGTYKNLDIAGVLGANVLDDTLVWTFDRDAQMIYIETQEVATPPAEAMTVEASRINQNRFFADVKVGGKTLDMEIDFERPASSVWPELAASAGLAPMGGQSHRDAFGHQYRYDSGWLAPEVRIGQATVPELVMFPFTDKRVRKADYDGVIGRDVFARFNVTVNWHHEMIWLRPRNADAADAVAARLSRWGGALAACGEPGCVSSEIATSETGATAVMFSRDPSAAGLAYDVTLRAVNESGRPLPLPPLFAAFSPERDQVILAGPDAAPYAQAAAFRAIDITPFPPPCDGGCVAAVN